jgi:hypothetical protein
MYLMNSVFMPELDKFVVVFIEDWRRTCGTPTHCSKPVAGTPTIC